MSHATAAVAYPKAQKGPSGVTEWATWVLTMAVVIMLGASFVLWQQITNLNDTLTNTQVRISQLERSSTYRQCLILTSLDATPAQLAAAACGEE